MQRMNLIYTEIDCDVRGVRDHEGPRERHPLTRTLPDPERRRLAENDLPQALNFLIPEREEGRESK
jgi:hypothetical protein